MGFLRPFALAAVCCALGGCAHTPAARIAAAPAPQALIAKADRSVPGPDVSIAWSRHSTSTHALRSNHAVAEAAQTGALATAILIALGERELGLLEAPFLDRAQELAHSSSRLQTAYEPLFSTSSSRCRRGGSAVRGRQPTIAASRRFRRRIATGTRGWTCLRPRAAQDVLSAYLWLAFNCTVPTNGINRGDIPRWMTEAGPWADAPLLKYRAATCGSYDRAVLADLVNSNPRFVEIDYFLAFTATRNGKLDEAAALLETAFKWRPRWPAVTLADQPASPSRPKSSTSHMNSTSARLRWRRLRRRAAWRHQSAHLRRPSRRGARRGRSPARARALVHRRRAILARAERRAARALRRRVGRRGACGELIVNADVPKLAGIIAYRRHQLDVSRAKFEESRTRNPGRLRGRLLSADCRSGAGDMGSGCRRRSSVRRSASIIRKRS